jgi:hypothetical protein
MKGRAERIASITDPWNLAAAFAQDRIVHRYQDGFVWLKAFLNAPTDLSIELRRLNALVRIEPVIGAPIAMQLTVGG